MRQTKSLRHAKEGTDTLSAQSRTAVIVSEALQSLAPGDAAARLRWLVDFSQQDLALLSEDELVAQHIRLQFIAAEKDWSLRGGLTTASGDHTVDPRQRQALRRIQPTLREYFHTLVRNERFVLAVPRGGRWVFLRGQFANGKVWILSGGPLPQWGTVPHWRFQLVLLANRFLGDVGPGKLMACPLVQHDGDAPCGRIFLAQRATKIFCSHECAQKSVNAKAAKGHKGK